MRIVLVGAVESSLVALRELARHGMSPLALVTLPFEKSLRHSDFVDLRPLAEELNIQVIETGNVNSIEVLARLRDLKPDYIAVIGWSQLCRSEFLALARYGCIGFHPSLLPANRGRAVIAWTILQRLRQTGASLFWLAPGVDAGDLLAQRAFDVEPDETVRSLIDKHLVALGLMLRECLPLLAAGEGRRTPQDHSLATYCAKRTPEDGWIDWNCPAEDVWALIRATSQPYPGAFTVYRKQKLTIWSADLVLEDCYRGLPGQVQDIRKDGVLIQCGDGLHILAKRASLGSGGETDIPEIRMKMHERLGSSPVATFEDKEKGH